VSVHEKIMRAAEQLAASEPFDRITFAEVAKLAGVHWTAVRRHFGGKREMREWLREKQAERHNGEGAALADTRTRILEAAEKVFAEHGYGGASLEKVASAAGMTKGAVYWHFSSKQDVYLAMMERHLSRQQRQLPGQIQAILEAEDPELALRQWFQSQLDCLEEGNGNPMLFFEFVTSTREPEVREKLQTVYGTVLDAVGAFLKDMRSKGYIAAEVDPRHLGVMIDALLKGVLIEWLIDPQRCQLQPLMETMSRVLWRGIAPNRPKGVPADE